MLFVFPLIQSSLLVGQIYHCTTTTENTSSLSLRVFLLRKRIPTISTIILISSYLHATDCVRVCVDCWCTCVHLNALVPWYDLRQIHGSCVRWPQILCNTAAATTITERSDSFMHRYTVVTLSTLNGFNFMCSCFLKMFGSSNCIHICVFVMPSVNLSFLLRLAFTASSSAILHDFVCVYRCGRYHIIIIVIITMQSHSIYTVRIELDDDHSGRPEHTLYISLFVFSLLFSSQILQSHRMVLLRWEEIKLHSCRFLIY